MKKIKETTMPAPLCGDVCHDRIEDRLKASLVAVWGEDLPIQRCTGHKHRHLLSHALKTIHDMLTEDDRDMICADTAAGIESRTAFLQNGA